MKRAVLIGLNYTGTEYELPDCELDADNMAVLLKAVGVECDVVKGEVRPEAFISYLTSTAATQHKNTDTLYIYFSGHGTQVSNRKEADRQDEALCFYDHTRGIVALKDDDLCAALDQVPGSKIIILDCCFSGGMERMINFKNSDIKRIAFTDKMQAYNLPDTLKRQKALSAGKTYFLFACGEGEVSYSTGYGGLFTNGLRRGISEAGERTISKLMRFCRLFCGTSQTPTTKVVGGNTSKRIL